MKEIHVVGAVIVNEAGDVLCALRSNTMSLPSYWEFPGGKIEPGENPHQALVREIREELSCHISVGKLIADSTHTYPERIVRLITYFSRITNGQPTPQEHEKLIWLPVNQLHQLKWAPADIPTVQKLSTLGI